MQSSIYTFRNGFSASHKTNRGPHVSHRAKTASKKAANRRLSLSPSSPS